MNTPWLPENQTPSIVLVSAAESVRDQVSRVAAAAGAKLTAVLGAAEALAVGAPLLLVDVDVPLPRLPADIEVIVVGLNGQETQVWERAAALSAHRAAVLPSAAVWLADYLGRASGPIPGRVVGVAGATGGTGATTLSCLLAYSAAADGLATCLVDGVPLDGGIDGLLAARGSQGIRWPDLADVKGTLNPRQLLEALPVVSGMSVLSWTRSPEDTMPEAEPMASAVLDAVRTGFDLAIVDLGGSQNQTALAACCDTILVVLPGRRRAIDAGRNFARQLAPIPASVVVRGPVADGLDPQTIADMTGAPLAGYLPHQRGMAAAEESGTVLEYARRRRLQRALGGIIAHLDVPAGRTA